MEAKLDSLGKAIYKNIKKEILNENKIKSKILKTAKLNSFVWWNEKGKNINRSKAKIILQSIKINGVDYYIFLVDIDGDNDTDQVYDINGNAIYYDFKGKANYIPGLEINEEVFKKIMLVGTMSKLVELDMLLKNENVKKIFDELTLPEYFQYFFSDKYITLLDFVRILKAFDKFNQKLKEKLNKKLKVNRNFSEDLLNYLKVNLKGILNKNTNFIENLLNYFKLNLKEKLNENIKKLCKLEKEKFGTQEVCNKYKNLYEKVWKEKLKEFPEIIIKGTKTVTTFGGQLYTYYYQENELKELKGFVPEENYKEFLEILKQRDIKFAKNAVKLMKKGELDFDGVKINIGNFFNSGNMKYEYLGEDNIKVSNGKKYFIINPLEKILVVNGKKIDFYVLDKLLYSVDNIDEQIEEKEKKALEYTKKYISLINKGYIIFTDKKGGHNYKILNIKELFGDFWKRKLDIKYLKNDIVQITDGKEKILMNTNPGKKYVIYKEKKIYFGLNPDKINVLDFKIDNYKP